MALDYGEYSIDERYRQYGNGYDQLEGEWLTYYKVATKFAHKAQAQDRDDLLHTIILNLAVAGKSNGQKPDNPSWMYRIASFTVAQYWRDYYYQRNGIDCGYCSNWQRRKCKRNNYLECPRAIRIQSLDKPIVGEDGQISELGELIADDKAIGLDSWIDHKTFLPGFPQKLIDIAKKVRDGIPLNRKEQTYLDHYRARQLEKSQKPLF